MKFEIIDNNVSLTMNIFIIIANIINIVYNIPQMVKTYKCKSTKDLSSWFLFLRIIGNSIWIAYAIEVDSMMILINTSVTVFSSIFIGYYKVLELNRDRLEKNNQKLLPNYKNINYSKCNNEFDISNNSNSNENSNSNSNNTINERYDNTLYEV